MSVTPMKPPRRIPRQGIVSKTADSGWGAGWLTGGALIVALVLGFSMPAKAEGGEDRVMQPEDDYWTIPAKRPKVPKVCALVIDGEERSVTFYSERCLRAEGFDHRLPRGCANSATILGHADRVYSASCLRGAGFRVPGQ